MDNVNGVVDLGGGIRPFDQCNFRIVIDITTEEGEFDDGIPTVFIEHDLTHPLSEEQLNIIKEYSDKIDLINMSLLLSDVVTSWLDLIEDGDDIELISEWYLNASREIVANILRILRICNKCRRIRIVDNLFNIAVPLEMLLLIEGFRITSVKLLETYMDDRLLGDFEIILEWNKTRA